MQHKSYKDLWPGDEMVSFVFGAKDAVLVLHLATLAGGHTPNINLAARPTPTRTSHAFLRCVEPKKETRTGCQATLLYLEYLNKGKPNGPCRIHLPPRSKDNTKLSEHHHQPDSGHSPYFGFLEPANSKLHLKVGTKIFSRQDVARIEAGLKSTGRKQGYAIQSRHTKDVLVKCLGESKDKTPCKWQVRLVPAPNGQQGHTISEIDPKHICDIKLAQPSENLLKVLNFFPEVTLEAGLIGKSKRQQVRKRGTGSTAGGAGGSKQDNRGRPKKGSKSGAGTPAMTPDGDDASESEDEEGVLSDNEIEVRCFELISLCPPPPPEDEEMNQTYQEAKQFMLDGGKKKKKKQKVGIFTYAAVAGGEGDDNNEGEEQEGEEEEDEDNSSTVGVQTGNDTTNVQDDSRAQSESATSTNTNTTNTPRLRLTNKNLNLSNSKLSNQILNSSNSSSSTNVEGVNEIKGKRAAAKIALDKTRGSVHRRDKSSSLSPAPSEDDDEEFGQEQVDDDDEDDDDDVASEDEGVSDDSTNQNRRKNRSTNSTSKKSNKNRNKRKNSISTKSKKRSRVQDDDEDEEEEQDEGTSTGEPKQLRPRSSKIEYRPYTMGTADDFGDEESNLDSIQQQQQSNKVEEINSPKKKRVKIDENQQLNETSMTNSISSTTNVDDENKTTEVGSIVEQGQAIVIAKDESGRMDLDSNSIQPPTVTVDEKVDSEKSGQL
ncbi:hypothetical protein OIO90_004852 [Microbotryomycetes sp. JL221]|nr:hypothetical protein OIO90_004852 [Microbotryomycetes sp. JL221]